MSTREKTNLSLLARFEEAIDVFERAVAARSEDGWRSSLWVVQKSDPWVWPKEDTLPVATRTAESIQVFSACWYVAAHCAFFLDFYLSGPNIEGYAPQSPFEAVANEGFDADGAIELPAWSCTREQVLAYIAYGRDKAQTILPSLTDDELKRTMPATHPWAGSTYAQLLDVDLAHVKEHGAQIAG